MKTIAVGLSGGVDSTLTALLLKEQGYQVIGLSMSIYNKDIPNMQLAGKSCYGPTEKQDIKDIHKWAMGNGIDSHIIDLSEDFKKVVLGYFREAYMSGITPNPCVKCNEAVKFGLLINRAREMGIHFDAFATGHYARVTKKGDRFVIQKGADAKKDQSYFLYRLTQKQLSEVMLPLGGFTKEQTRIMARERGLAVADKPDSQDFYSGDYTDLLQQKPRPGQIVHTSGKVLGKHMGFWNYTIGQRKGLGIAWHEPLFVVDIDVTRNAVIVGGESDTLKKTCIIHDCNWMGLSGAPEKSITVMAKYRSAGKPVPATIVAQGEDVLVTFDTPQKSITRGQSVVFYDGDTVLGGGIIK